ncbi:MAG: leucyl/phenylalanyl-tRNA--protein transferase [Bacteroides sp. SM23_62_1]|nr:MAG: leucyl/phenylalanyl-tRNA--protein transferase [Bacteroides sp. SM23_62_1]
MAGQEQTESGIIFPNPDTADTDGLLAIGGNLEVPTLIKAYSNGIFPWYAEGTPILWWSPNPRMILLPEKFKISKTLQQVLHSEKFEVRFDYAFDEVIEYCARIRRKGQHGTWITDAMIDAYKRLHLAGYAHSVETYCRGRLAGGLYGVSIGRTFFGESMFHVIKDASKVALYYLVVKLLEWNFDLIDTQQSTKHLKSLGAEEISRKKFLELLKDSLKKETIRGNWGSVGR